VENECTLYNVRLFAIFVLKIIRIVEIWWSYNKNNFAWFFESWCRLCPFCSV